MKLHHKTRHGARVHKLYDRAQPPYRRLLASGVLGKAQQKALEQAVQALEQKATGQR